MNMNRTEARETKQGRARDLAEIGKPEFDETEVLGSALGGVELEAFMHEPVLIYVHKARDPQSHDVIVPSVNGINQPIVRGQEVMVKRKYVESLARAHTIRYEQRVSDPSRPDSIQMVPKKVPDYPFDVREDSRKGKAWLDAIYATL